MAETAKRDSPEMRYLLGTLSEDEGIRLEETFFADEAKFEDLELAEDELIDAYVREELSTEEQRQFETRIRKSPRLIERVYFARALAERVSNHVRQENEVSTDPAIAASLPILKPVPWWRQLFGQQPGFRVAFAACLVLLLVGSAALVAGWLRVRSASERMAVERAALQRQEDDLDKQLSEQRNKTSQLTNDLEATREQLAAELKRIDDLEHGRQRENPNSRLLGPVFSVFLSPGLPRGGPGSKPELKIAPSTSAVQLNILLERNDYRSYNLSVTTVGGAVVWTQKNLKPRNTGSTHLLTLSVPAHLLSSHDYIVNVAGVSAPAEAQSVNDYQFRIIKK